MDKLISLMQLVMSIIMLLGTIYWGIAHLIKETIGFFDILIVLLFASVMYLLGYNSWREYQQVKNR